MTRAVVFRRFALCMLAGLAVGAMISEVSYYFLKTGETRPPQVIEVDIPMGTARRVAEGVSDPSLPTSMTFVVGDTLVVRNEDAVVHQLGPLIVPPGASSSIQLQNTQDLTVTCSFQPGKYIGLVVQSPLTLTTRLLGILEVGTPMGLLIGLYGLFAIPIKKEVAA